MSKAIPPLIPPSSNNSSLSAVTTRISKLDVVNQLSFFGAGLSQQLTLDNSSNIDIYNSLKTYGLFSSGDYYQDGPRIIGSPATGANLAHGFSVSLSADGTVMSSGAPYNNADRGGAWVHKRVNGYWSEDIGPIEPSATIDTLAGWCVSLSGDGTTLAIGGPGDTGYVGAAWVYKRNSDRSWTLQNKLVGTGYTGSSEQGTSLALSYDGNTLVVGGYADNSNRGAVWVFTRSGASWTQQGSKLIGTGATGSARQGRAVAIDDDGNTIAVGGSADNSFTGATWIFTRSGDTWSQEGSKIVGTGSISGPLQGISVAVKSDVLAVGGYSDNNSIGATWVFRRSNGTWTQEAKLISTDYTSSFPQQGYSVSLSGDGTILVVSAPFDDTNIGAIFVYKYASGTWTQSQKIIGGGYVQETRFGENPNGVCISNDGSTIAFGGNYSDVQLGGTWIFKT